MTRSRHRPLLQHLHQLLPVDPVSSFRCSFLSHHIRPFGFHIPGCQFRCSIRSADYRTSETAAGGHSLNHQIGNSDSQIRRLSAFRLHILPDSIRAAVGNGRPLFHIHCWDCCRHPHSIRVQEALPGIQSPTGRTDSSWDCVAAALQPDHQSRRCSNQEEGDELRALQVPIPIPCSIREQVQRVAGQELMAGTSLCLCSCPSMMMTTMVVIHDCWIHVMSYHHLVVHLSWPAGDKE